MLKFAGAIVGQNVRICSSVKFLGNGKLSIGNNCWIGPETFITSTSPNIVYIGNNVDIAPRVYIGTGSHEIDMVGPHSAGKGISIDVTINDGAWLCTNAVILPGVIIGKKTVVAAGSVVNRNIDDYCIVAGNPGKVVKEFDVLSNSWKEKSIP